MQARALALAVGTLMTVVAGVATSSASPNVISATITRGGSTGGDDNEPAPTPESEFEAAGQASEPAEPKEATQKNRQMFPKAQRNGWSILPLASYSPETELALGGLVIRFFRPEGAPEGANASSVALVALYTTRSQAIFEIQPELYSPQEDWHLWNKVEYQKFPDRFWGIGYDAGRKGSNEERYERRVARARSWLRYRIAGELRLGAQLDLHYLEANYRSAGSFATEEIPGEPGGRSFGGGPTVSWDSREHAIAPLRGGLYEVGLTTYTSNLGSEYDFSRLTIDMRRFFHLGKRHVAATRIYGELSAGQVPFYMLPQLGGADLLRGYFRGRYRDQALAAVEAEYRTPIYLWRLSSVAFAGLGVVGESVDELDPKETLWSAGAGMRVSLNKNERLNLRLDVGFGQDSMGIYVSAREAF